MSFMRLWTENYPDSLPVPHQLKYRFGDRWLRIYSLPEGKRYAENDDERRELLVRQNTIVSDLIGEENTFALLLISFSETPGFPEHFEGVADLAHFELQPSLDLHARCPDEYESEYFLRMAYRECYWKRNSLDNLLLEIAEDKLQAILLGRKQNCLVSPYDGGMDLVLGDPQERSAIGNKYSEWCSQRPDGL
jgi:hypothetical protein